MLEEKNLSHGRSIKLELGHLEVNTVATDAIEGRESGKAESENEQVRMYRSGNTLTVGLGC